MDESPVSILVVDDNEIFRERLMQAFTRRGYLSFGAADYDEGLQQASKQSLDLAVVDLRMPGKSGLELVRDMHAAHPQMRITVLTGYGSIATALDAVRLGAVNYLTKPATADEILAAFEPSVPLEVEVSEEQLQAPSLARVEWEHIHRVLADCDGNISKAARVLGIHRRSLQRKLAKYPLPR